MKVFKVTLYGKSVHHITAANEDVAYVVAMKEAEECLIFSDLVNDSDIEEIKKQEVSQ